MQVSIQYWFEGPAQPVTQRLADRNVGVVGAADVAAEAAAAVPADNSTSVADVAGEAAAGGGRTVVTGADESPAGSVGELDATGGRRRALQQQQPQGSSGPAAMVGNASSGSGASSSNASSGAGGSSTAPEGDQLSGSEPEVSSFDRSVDPFQFKMVCSDISPEIGMWIGMCGEKVCVYKRSAGL